MSDSYSYASCCPSHSHCLVVRKLEAEVERLRGDNWLRRNTLGHPDALQARIDAALELVRLWRGDDPEADVITTAQLVGGLETALTGADE